jgi:hypothetical protein
MTYHEHYEKRIKHLQELTDKKEEQIVRLKNVLNATLNLAEYLPILDENQEEVEQAIKKAREIAK